MTGVTVAVPHDKGAFDLTYHKGPFQWYWQAQYTGPFNFDNSDTPDAKDIMGVSHWWLVNTTLTYSFTPAFQTRLIIDNVADKEPPYPALAGTGGNFATATSLYFPGIIGRTYLLEASYHFWAADPRPRRGVAVAAAAPRLVFGGARPQPQIAHQDDAGKDDE